MVVPMTSHKNGNGYSCGMWLSIMMILSCVVILTTATKPFPSNSPLSKLLGDVDIPTSVPTKQAFPNLPDMNKRIDAIIQAMTTEQKAQQLDVYHGTELLTNGTLDMTKLLNIVQNDGLSIVHDFYPPSAEWPNIIQQIQLNKSATGIPILFIEECLHGLGGAGNSGFPAALSLGATFNKDLGYLLGKAIASEVRSYGIRWCLAPVIGVTREPRWGRSEETISEDTTLTAIMARNLVFGMQGFVVDNNTVVSEPKHFAVHSIPEGGRNTAVAHVGMREVEEIFLPTFRAAVHDANALGIMAAYSEIDGIPNPSNSYLLTDKLRDDWGFQGFVLSDEGAVSMMYTTHGTAATAQDAIVDFLKAGGNCQFYDFLHQNWTDAIVGAVNEGMLSMDVLDSRVADVVRVKMLLELDKQPLTNLSLVQQYVLSKPNYDVSLGLALESIVLLNNSDHILPLNPEKLKKIAIVGPCADRLQTGDYYAAPNWRNFEFETTLLEGIEAYLIERQLPVQIAHSVGIGIRTNQDFYPIRKRSLPKGLTANYWTNTNMSGSPTLTRTDLALNLHWYHYGFDYNYPQDTFSATWTGILYSDVVNPYAQISIDVTDNALARVYLNGQLIIDGWQQAGTCQPCTVNYALQVANYDLRVEYSKTVSGDGNIVLSWSRVQNTSYTFPYTRDIAADSDAIIVAIGDSESTSGESVDALNLDMPNDQVSLVYYLAEQYPTTPIIVMLFSGRAHALSDLALHPTLIEAFTPGEAQGVALAQILFGDVSPSGKLPISIPATTGEIPIFYNCKPSGRPNTYFDSDLYNGIDTSPIQPLFPFGYGLSYSSFSYHSYNQSSMVVSRNSTLKIQFQVTNTGAMGAQDVAQFYIRDQVSTTTQPIISLKNFTKFYLDPKESTTVTFEVDIAREFAIVDRSMNWVVEPGNFTLYISRSSADHQIISWVYVSDPNAVNRGHKGKPSISTY